MARERLVLLIDPVIVERMDAARGSTPRSAYIASALDLYIEENELRGRATRRLARQIMREEDQEEQHG